MWRQVRFGRQLEMTGLEERPERGRENLPLVVTLSGLGQAMSEKNYLFSQLRKRLADRRQWVVQFDYRGHGDSQGELGEVSLSTMVADTLQVLHELTRQTTPPAIYLVGHALGAVVALQVTSIWNSRTGADTSVETTSHPSPTSGPSLAIPVLISPPPLERADVYALFPPDALKKAETVGAIDARELIPGEDYYTFSDLDADQVQVIQQLGAHLLYLHGQRISSTMIHDWAQLNMQALYEAQRVPIHLLHGVEDEVSSALTTHVQADIRLCPFQPGRNFYHHPAAMDDLIRKLCNLIVPQKACQGTCTRCRCETYTRQANERIGRKQDDHVNAEG
ncbi:alpha/beta hydrolase [Marinicrinis sediminis]|uniref:Alpha/beta hydrolase n=1 Tax=Marinicrinis sediminis TaxID=1652465 RepID=A0ABW5RF61_9BACL